MAVIITDERAKMRYQGAAVCGDCWSRARSKVKAYELSLDDVIHFEAVRYAEEKDHGGGPAFYLGEGIKEDDGLWMLLVSVYCEHCGRRVDPGEE